MEGTSHADDLFSMVCYANDNVPFYMNLYREYQDSIEEEKFTELPVIDKEMYVSGGTSGLSVEYMKEYINNELIWTRTSGTSGMFSEVYWHPKEMQRSLLPLWLLRKKYYNISAYNRMCSFYPAGEGNDLYIEKRNSLAVARTSLYDGRLEEVYKKILSYDPEWMILQPSIALLLCGCAEKYGKPEALRYIEFTGEYLELSVRKKTEGVFQCQTADQYGTKEVNSIAFECPCGKLHILSDNVYVETVNDKNEADSSYICITSLQNYAMPLIRYQLEDRGKIYRNVSCACGCTGDVLELESGRANDMVVMRDYSVRHPYMLMEIFQAINYGTEGGILQYQIEQRTINVFTVRLVLEEEELLEEITEEIRRAFYSKLGYAVEIQFEYFETALPMAHEGKPAVFRSAVTYDDVFDGR